MRNSILKLAAMSVAMSALAVSAPAFAQEEEAESGPITITGGITGVSDYRFRGVSLSDKDFAIRLTKEAGVATIPVSAFYQDSKDDKVLRFCFSKSQETLERAVEKLVRL